MSQNSFKMNKPDISVILPFYNISEFLEEAIISVLNQTFSNFELILINDGSTDESLNLAKQFELSDSRVKIINQHNQGMAKALNRGIESAKANIIARMDGDDICHPQRFEKQFSMIITMPENSHVSSLVKPFSSTIISEGSERYFRWLNSKITHEEILEGLFKESPIIHPSAMFTKKAYIDAGGYREYNGPEDYDLWLNMALTSTTFKKYNETLLEYRIHKNNLSRNDMTHYSREAFKIRQAQFLTTMIKNGFFDKKDNFVICGAGKEGKRVFNILNKHKIPISLFIDVDPKKIGKTYKSIDILSVEQINRDSNLLYLGVTGSWRSEELLLHHFKQKKMTPLLDFLIL